MNALAQQKCALMGLGYNMSAMNYTTIQPVTTIDAQEFLAFEDENRSFFNRELGLPDSEQPTLEQTAQMLAEREREWSEDRAFHYVIRDPDDRLVGHIQLFNVQRGMRQRAELGYRVAAKHGGKGYATAAVRQTVTQAFDTHGLHRLESSTILSNKASQAVLLKNGFVLFGHAAGAYRFDGNWVDILCFERLNANV